MKNIYSLFVFTVIQIPLSADLFNLETESIFKKFNSTPLDSNLKKIETAFTRSIFADIREKYTNDPHAQQGAMVRTHNALAQEEQRYLQLRKPKIRSALRKMGIALPKGKRTPRIAFCGSGGGYRAMISTLGYLQGAAKLGLLDASTYNIGLSGSTWAIAGLIESGMPIDQYIHQIKTRVTQDLITNINFTELVDALLKKIAFGQPVTLIDVYGNLIAQKLLKGLKNTYDSNAFTLNSPMPKETAGNNSFPIYTALIDTNPYTWLEFTPYEIGSTTLRSFIPTWAFGRTFLNGKSTDFAPAPSLGFCMGIWGSAMSVNMQDIMVAFEPQIKQTIDATIGGSGFFIHMLIQNSLEKYTIGKSRALPAEVANWTAGIKGPLKDIDTLTLLDAGIDFNLPLPPALRKERNVDIIIILDASETTQGAPELKKAEAYAKRHLLPFPNIDYSKTDTLCSVHHDPHNVKTPIIVYMPLTIADKFSTFDFAYSPEKFDELSQFTESAMVKNKEKIIYAIQLAISR